MRPAKPCVFGAKNPFSGMVTLQEQFAPGSLDPALPALYSKMPSQGGSRMASTRAMLERRRSSRVLIRIPVKIFSNDFHGQPLGTPAEAIAVSRTGALLRTPFHPQFLGHPVSRRTPYRLDYVRFESPPASNGLPHRPTAQTRSKTCLPCIVLVLYSPESGPLGGRSSSQL